MSQQTCTLKEQGKLSVRFSGEVEVDQATCSPFADRALARKEAKRDRSFDISAKLTIIRFEKRLGDMEPG
jgi:hypothetical protein